MGLLQPSAIQNKLTPCLYQSSKLQYQQSFYLNTLTMAQRYYEFHFAVRDGQNFINNGILLYYTSKALTKDQLITHTRECLNDPAANVVITHITKLSKKEYTSRKNQQIPG